MIHLIVGNTGAGKTSYCKQLKEKSKAIVFSIDQWNNILFMPDKTDKDGLEWFLERITRAESMIKNLILQLENTSTDSILDLGFSKFEHREAFRKFAAQHNIETQLHYLDVDKDLRWKRVQKRNVEKGETYEFHVSKENFDFMEIWFEIPNENELKNAIISSE